MRYSPRYWQLLAVQQGLFSESRCADGFIASCYLRKPSLPFVHKNLIGTLSSLRQRQESRTGEQKERREITLSKDALGCTVSHLCLSIIKPFNSCLSLNTNWRTKWNQNAIPVPCYLVKEAPMLPIAF